jgi:uncharacterized protein
MSGETDLAILLASMEPTVRPGEFVMVSCPTPDAGLATDALAMIVEDEGPTYVLRRADADAHGQAYDFVAGWITLTVHSSLAAVGLTAAFARALGDEQISCNVLAGYYHDHLLVPADRIEDALLALRKLATL